MRVTQTVKKLVDAKLRAGIKTAEKHYGIKIKPPAVVYRKRGTTAGTANYQTWTIDLNPTLLMENQDTFIARTVPHELAHLIDYQLHPENFETRLIRTRTGRLKRSKRDVHGATWKRIMIVLGADPSRCHDYDVSNAKVHKRGSQRRHVWRSADGRGEIVLTDHKHKKQLAAAPGYGYYQRGFPPSRAGNYSYHGIQGQTLEPMPLAADKPVPEPAPKAPRIRNAAHDGKSKLDICRMWYTSGLTRKAAINMFIIKAGCTPAGAATYYAKIKKEQG